jgi:hypothetical protein
MSGAPGGLTAAALCSTFVLMEVETIGVARSLGWKVHMRCANGYRQETRSMRRCVYRKQLDLVHTQAAPSRWLLWDRTDSGRLWEIEEFPSKSVVKRQLLIDEAWRAKKAAILCKRLSSVALLPFFFNRKLPWAGGLCGPAS